jgi:hypothetical protein
MKPLLWMAVPLLLVGAVMLLAGIGASGLWIALIVVGLALVAIGVGKRGREHGGNLTLGAPTARDDVPGGRPSRTPRP